MKWTRAGFEKLRDRYAYATLTTCLCATLGGLCCVRYLQSQDKLGAPCRQCAVQQLLKLFLAAEKIPLEKGAFFFGGERRQGEKKY